MEAIREYETISEQFPAEVRPYLVMMEIAYVNLHDGERGDAIVKRALATLRDDASRQEVLRMHRSIKARELHVAPPAAPVETDGGCGGSDKCPSA